MRDDDGRGGEEACVHMLVGRWCHRQEFSPWPDSPQSLRLQPKVEQDDGGGHAGIIGGAPRLSASVCQNINGKLSR